VRNEIWLYGISYGGYPFLATLEAGKGDLGGVYTFFYDHGDDFQELYDFVRRADEK
jgi:hypothetical protein